MGDYDPILVQNEDDHLITFTLSLNVHALLTV